MKIISPSLGIEQQATTELIKEVVEKLEGKEDPFAILEENEMTYMQVLWTEDGYDLEYQEDDIYHHYWLKNFISQEDAVWAMQSYLNKQPYWKTKFEFENKEIATSSQKIGYKVGRFLGTVLKTLTNK